MTKQLRQRKQDKPLEAHIERRKRLWTQVIRENPSYSEAEIVARLEQFGVWPKCTLGAGTVRITGSPPLCSPKNSHLEFKNLREGTLGIYK